MKPKSKEEHISDCLTIMQLVVELKEVIKNGVDPNSKVFLSRDSEGNGFSTLTNRSITISENKNIVLYPFFEGVEYEDL